MSIEISLCMIVWNEHDVLERCLAAARPAVDQICIVDTGSTDDTLVLAGRFGARVATFLWNDDFAAARNRSLELATGDWILVLDADEVLREPLAARGRLQQFAADGPHRVGRLDVVNHTAADAEPSVVPITRFFPADGRHRFQGPIHEQVVVPGQEPPRADTGCALDHYGYTPEALRAKDKLARNTELLQQAALRAPSDPYLWYQLGRTYSVAQRHSDALQAYEQALEHAPPEAPYGPHLLESAGYELRAIGRSKEALSWLSSVETNFRQRADMCFLIALLAMDVGDLGRAERGFRHCLTLSGQVPFGGESSPSASTTAPAYNLGVMYEVLGRLGEAAAFYRQALGWNAAHGPSRQGLERVSSQA